MNNQNNRGRPRRRRVGRVRNVVTNTDRERLVNAYENGDNFIVLADQLEINRDTARSIIRVWMNEGRTNRLDMGGRRDGNTKVDDEMIGCILAIVQEKPFTTLTKLNEDLQERLPDKPHITISTIARHLQDQLITLKIAGKDADVPFRRNTAQTKEVRYQYAIWLTNIPINHKIVYIDESGFNLYQRRTQGRAPRGEAVHREIENSRGRNVNVIIALCSEGGILAYSVSQETLDHARYQQFIDRLVMISVARFNDPIHIVHDGARPHIGTVIHEQYAQQLDIRTLPPYSPFLNPVEQAHSCFKAAVGRQLTQPNIQDQLRDAENARREYGLNLGQWRSRLLSRLATEAILEELTPAKCAQWSNRVHRFIPASLARDNILG